MAAWCLGLMLAGPVSGQDGLADLSQVFTVTTANERTTLDRQTRKLVSTVDVDIRNVSGNQVRAPVHLVVETGSAEVEVTGASGGPTTLPYNAYYIDVSSQLSDGVLTRDGSVTGRLEFVRATDVTFQYQLRVFAALNAPPVPEPGGPYSVTEGGEILFDGTASSDPDQDPLDFLWDFGDGTTSTAAAPSKVYARVGLYSVMLTVTDTGGAARSAEVPVPVIPPGELGLARTRVLDGAGHPLRGVQIHEVGPAGARTAWADAASGFVTLGGGAGNYSWKFTRDGYLPVWRRQTLGEAPVAMVPNPRLVKREAPTVTISPIQAGVVSDDERRVSLSFPVGAFAQFTDAAITPLSGQTLPGPLPQGWSPLRAVHFYLAGEPALAGSAEIAADALREGELAVWATWQESDGVWMAEELLSGGSHSTVTVAVAHSGSFALVVPDKGALAPAVPAVSEALSAGTAAVPDPSTLTATGAVNPSSSAASLDPEQVTAQATVVFTAAALLPSGSSFLCAVDETYRLSGGFLRKTPGYETFITAYQRPGDTRQETAEATFPMRPLLLFGPAELDEAGIHVDVENRTPFSGGVIGSSGGPVQGPGVQLTFADGDLDGLQAVEIRALNPDGFAGLVDGVGEVERAFELNVGGLTPDRVIDAAMHGLTPHAAYVLVRLVFQDGIFGLQPVERFLADAGGELQSMEPAVGPRLSGVTGAGQYILVGLDQPQGLVTGVARDETGSGAAGLVVTIDGQFWLAVSGPGGAYSLLAPAGAVQVIVRDPVTGNTGGAAGELTDLVAGLALDGSTAPTAPEVVLVDPPEGAVDVRRATSIEVLFSEPIQAGDFAGGGIRLLDPTGGVVAASVSLDLAGTTGSLYPTDPLQPDTHYTVDVSPSLVDVSGLPIAGLLQSTFTTEALPVRVAGAQLVIYEPGATDCPCAGAVPGYPIGDTGIVCVEGSPGVADANVPVILLNETSGATATVVAGPDGSFLNFVAAGETDFISAVFVNANGTTVTVPASRQLYDDGSVGLYRGGGVLEAQSDGGPVEIFVEPGSVPARTKFRMGTVSALEALSEAGGVQPENGAVLGGFRLDISGDELTEPPDVSFPIRDAQLNLGPGETVDDRVFSLCTPIVVDGVPLYEIVDRMEYEDGNLVTHSPPFPGLPALPATSFLFIPLMIAHGNEVILVGKVVTVPADEMPVTEEEVRNGETTTGIPLRRLPGAIVSAASGVNDQSGRLRPGGIVGRTNSRAYYSIQYSYNGILPDPVLLRAQHFLHPGNIGSTVLVPPGPGLGVTPVAVGNIPVIIASGSASDIFPPFINVDIPSAVLPVNEDVSVDVYIRDNASLPTFQFITLDAQKSVSLVPTIPFAASDVLVSPGASTNTGPNSIRLPMVLHATNSVQAVYTITAVDGAGNQREAPVAFRFGKPPDEPVGDPEPVDPFDQVGPQVVSTVPADGTQIYGTGLTVYFDEPISRAIEQIGGVIVTPDIPYLAKLNDEQNVLAIDFSHLQPGTTYNVTLISGFCRDLSDNPLKSGSFTTTFTLPTLPQAQMGDITQTAGTTISGNLVFSMGREDDGKLVIHRIGDTDNVSAVGQLSTPSFPRALEVIPSYDYVTEPGGTVFSNRSLAVVSGGILGGVVGPWLWVVDTTDPTSPYRLASSLVSVDSASAVNIIRWDPPFLVLAINTVEASSLLYVNLQSFVLGDKGHHAVTAVTGVDANGDGDFVDEGDTLPVPERNSLFGQSFALPIAPQRFINDFDSTFAGTHVVAAIAKLGPRPSRLQVLTFQGGFIGNGGDSAGAVEMGDRIIRRVLVDLAFPLNDATGTRFIPAAIAAVDDQVEVYSLVDPTSPALVREVKLEDPGGNILSLVRSSGNEVVAGTPAGLYAINLGALGDEASASNSVTHFVAGSTAGRHQGATDLAFAMQAGGGLRVINRPPRIRVVRVPGLPVRSAKDIIGGGRDRILDYLDGTQDSGFLIPMFPLECGQLTNPNDMAPIEPPHPLYHYYLHVRASGSFGKKIPMAAESVSQGGYLATPRGEEFPAVLLSDHADAVGLTKNHRDVVAMNARRLSDNEADSLYTDFLSSPILLPLRCLRPDEFLTVTNVPERQLLLSNRFLRFGFDIQDNPDPDIAPFLARNVAGDFVPGTTRTYSSLPAEYLPSPNPTSPKAVAQVAGVDLQSGEFKLPEVDIAIEGRHQDLILQRSYASRACFSGDFGRNWDFNYHARLIEYPAGQLPVGLVVPLLDRGDGCLSATPGDVTFIDGVGGVFTFREIAARKDNLAERAAYETDPALDEFFGVNGASKVRTFYISPSGLYSVLYKLLDGKFMLVGQHGNRLMFNSLGRLERMVGAYEASVVELEYREDGLLDRVVGDRGLALEFGYFFPFLSPRRTGTIDPGSTEKHLIGKIGRVRVDPVLANKSEVEYAYDDLGNLVLVKPNLGDDIAYTYDTTNPALLTRTGLADGTEDPAMDIGYDEDGLVALVKVAGKELEMSGAKRTLKARYIEDGGEVTVNNATYKVDKRGRPTEFANREYASDEDGQPVKAQSLDQSVEMVYDLENPVYRFRGNLLRLEREAIGATGKYVSAFEYDGSALNRPLLVTDVNGDAISYTYPGNQVEETRGPVTVTTTQNEYGQPTREEASENGSPTFLRTFDYSLASLSPDGGLEERQDFTTSINHRRDSFGRPMEEGDRGVKLTINYDENSLILGQNPDDPLHPKVTFGYDDMKRLVEDTTEVTGQRVSLNQTYDSTHPSKVKTLTVEETGLQNSMTIYTYDDAARMTEMNVDGETTTFTYDDVRIIAVEGPGVSRSTTYDEPTRISEMVEQGVTTTFTYDDAGRMETMRSQGALTTMAYDSGGLGLSTRLSRKTIEDDAGSMLFSEDYQYDGAGRVRRIEGLGGRFREFAYFPDGGVREIKVSGTPVQKTDRDPQGRVTRQEVNHVVLDYSAFTTDTAMPQNESVSFKNGGGNVTTQKIYDRMGRPTLITVPAGSWEYAYDGFGNLISTKDPDGVEIKQTFSPGGRTLSSTFSDGTTAAFGYTVHQRLDTIFTAVGTMNFAYDPDGLIDTIDYPDGTGDTFRQRNDFFEPENVVQGEDAQSHVWNSDGRLEAIVQPFKNDRQEYAYDALGRTTRVSFNGEDVEFGFNSFGDLSSETGWAGTFEILQNERQHVLLATYPSGLILDYQADTFGQPLSLDAAGISSISWTAPSSPDTLLYGQDLRVQRIYDASLRMTGIEYRRGPAPTSPIVAGYRYDMTPGGRVLSEQRIHQGEFDVYRRDDPIDGMRIEEFLFAATDDTGAGSQASLEGLTFVNGELRAPPVQSNPALAPNGDIRGFFPSLTYVDDRLSQVDGQNVGFNASGSLSGFPVWIRLPGQSALTRVGATATYDGLGMIRAISRDDGVTVTYQRDGLGRIVERAVTGPANRCRPGISRYAWQGTQLIEVYEQGDPGQFHLAQRFIYLGSVPVMVEVADTPGPDATFTGFIPLVTLNGSIGGYLTTAGDLVETINYSAYGYPTFLRTDLDGTLARERSLVSNTVLFQGRWFDDCAGLYQLGQRNLHPMCGLFLQRDSALFTQSLALFTAFNGDPAGRVDPTGLASEDTIGQAKELKTAVNAAKTAYKSLQGLAEADAKGELGGLTGAAKYTDFLTKGITFSTTFSDADTKKYAAAAQSAQDVFKNGADILKSYQDMRKDRDLLKALQSVNYAATKGPMTLDTFNRDGSGGLLGVSNEAWKFGGNKAYQDALWKRNNPQALLSHYREQRGKIGRRRIKNLVSVGTGLSALSKIYREKVLTGTDMTTQRLNQMLKTSEAFTDVVSKGAEFLIENDDLIKFRHGMGLRSAVKYSRLLDKGPRNALSAALTFGQEFGKLLVIATSDDESAKAYMASVDQFDKNGGWVTVAGGILSTINTDFTNEAAYALQQYADFSITDILESLADSLMAERARQAERTQSYLNGISAP